MTEEMKAASARKSVGRTATGKEKAPGVQPEEKAPEVGNNITPEERWNMIAEAAYYIAEKRDFSGGHPAEDWRMAEEQIEAMLAKKD